jgi:ACS family hexuronate transporter-like MFS transporter
MRGDCPAAAAKIDSAAMTSVPGPGPSGEHDPQAGDAYEPYRPPRAAPDDVPAPVSSGASGTVRGGVWMAALCLVLLCATLLNYANRTVFTQNAVPVQAALSIKEQGYGELSGIFGLGFAFGGLLFGILADYVSVRRLYPLVVVAWSLAGAACGLAADFRTMWFCQLALGLFEGGHWPCALRTTQRAFAPDRRTLANSVLQSGASIGAVVTPLLVAALYRYDPTQWRLGFFIVGALGLPWAVWWLLSVRESDVRRPVIQTDEQAAGVGRMQPMEEIPFYRVFLTHRWWVLVMVVVPMNIFWHYIRVWMPITLEKDHGYGREFVQYFTALYYFVTFFGSLAAGSLTSVLPRLGWNVHRARLTAYLLFALLSSLGVAAAFAPRGMLLLALLLVVAFGSLGLFPIYYSFNQEISARNQGKVGGSLGFVAWAVLYFIHPAVGAWVDQDPSIRPYLLAAASCGPMLAFLALWLLWGRRPAAEAATR